MNGKMIGKANEHMGKNERENERRNEKYTNEGVREGRGINEQTDAYIAKGALNKLQYLERSQRNLNLQHSL